ncbi:MAG TPA: NAD(P) transhydrogenase subunit alpha [Opitutaceae bacterium]|nr:NAD(P) transhydrogenase subunit alpha [Opitutaceae bacterium]
MRVFAPNESPQKEPRAALTPEASRRLVELGMEVTVEAGLGEASGHPDSEYTAAGAHIGSAIGEADVVVRVKKPSSADVASLKHGALHLSFLDPFGEPDLIRALAAAGVSAVSLEMIPRTTIAQKMDVLSSQANLAGYSAVIQAAARLSIVFPMMMTPAGTINPARVFVIGVGVAGLQAIATAKRLGARVEAFDTRPAVEEQVKSLGARFVTIDLGETGQTAQGYAKALTPEQIAKQQAGMAKVCAQSDVVITTAKLFGRKAPVLVTSAMMAGMRAGSIVVDLAVEAGGNVEGSRPGEEVVTGNGVRVLGIANLEGMVARHASQVYASNLTAFLEHFWDKEARTLRVDPKDELLSACLITHGGAIVHPQFSKPQA